MRLTVSRATVLAVSLLLAQVAMAQKIQRVEASPSPAQAGQEVKVTTHFEVSNDVHNCTLQVHFGDGAVQKFHVNQAKDAPLVLTHTYNKPGRYTLKAEGKGLTRCTGENQTADLDVQASRPAGQGASGKSAAPVSPCPAGWSLAKPGVQPKTGAYSCSAKAGTAAPAAALECPGELSYFVNVKKGQLGCRP